MKSHLYTDDLIAEMARRLNAISLSMGFAKVNTPEVVLALAQWIKEQFGDMSMQEVSLAFDLVTAKKIGADIRHYNSFSKQYIGDVLYAFRTFRHKQMKSYEENEKTKELQERVPVSVSGEEMYNGIKKIAINDGKIMRVADWTGAFNYAWKERIIHRMTEPEREDYKAKVEKAIKTEKMGGIEIGDYSIQTECHRRIMQAHFQEMINSNKTEQNEGRN